MTPTGNWRPFHPAFLLGRRNRAVHRSARRRFFRVVCGKHAQINSLAICVNPGSAFNCYWPMPFRKHARVTLENLDDKDGGLLSDQRSPKWPGRGLSARTIFVGNRRSSQGNLYHPLIWWPGTANMLALISRGKFTARLVGRGEIKFFDGVTGIPDDCGHRNGGLFAALQFRHQRSGWKEPARFSRRPQRTGASLPPDKIYEPASAGLIAASPIRFRFKQDLKVTIQALGWQSEGRYLQLRTIFLPVAFWYQPNHRKFRPPAPGRT